MNELEAVTSDLREDIDALKEIIIEYPPLINQPRYIRIST